MAKKIMLFVGAIVALGSCTKGNLDIENTKTRYSIDAEISAVKTEVNDVVVNWSEGDKIQIVRAQEKAPAPIIYELDSSSAGTRYGSFSGETALDSKTSYFAFFPSSASFTQSDCYFSYNVPNSQGSETLNQIPLYSAESFKGNGKINFTHLCTVIKITLKGSGVKEIGKIEVRADNDSRNTPCRKFTKIALNEKKLSTTVTNTPSITSITYTINTTIDGSKDFYLLTAPKLKGGGMDNKWTISVYDSSLNEIASQTIATNKELLPGYLYRGTFTVDE